MGIAVGGREMIDALVSLGFGASLISIFARLGGGIFTKGADVGGDMVARSKPAFPRMTRAIRPPSPTMSATMSATAPAWRRPVRDLCGDHVATMVLPRSSSCRSRTGRQADDYPLVIGGVCIITSIIGTFFVRLGSDGNIMWAMYKGRDRRRRSVDPGDLVRHQLGWFGMDGAQGGRPLLHRHDAVLVLPGRPGHHGLIVWITEYYTGTDYRPVKAVAQASVTGHGTNVIAGLAMSMEARRCRRF